MGERINRYLKSLQKFINSDKSPYPTSFYTENKKFDKKNEDLFSLALLTLLSHNCNEKVHGYYIATGISLLEKLIKNMEDPNQNQMDEVRYLSPMTTVYCYKLLLQNLKTLKNYGKNYQFIENKSFQILDQSISNITSLSTNLEFEKRIKSDIIGNKIVMDFGIEKMKKIKQIKREVLDNWIDRYYGSLGKLSTKLGWLLGGGSETENCYIENIGYHLGWMLKIHSDFKNLKRDLYYDCSYSYNYLINYGISESYTKFLNNKLEFVKHCQYVGLYKKTIKQLIEKIEDEIESQMENCEPDLRSTYSSFS